jgi:hypothetical protein
MPPASADDPRRVTIFVNNLFHVFGFNVVLSNVFNVVFVPFGVPFPELHAGEYHEGRLALRSAERRQAKNDSPAIWRSGESSTANIPLHGA